MTDDSDQKPAADLFGKIAETDRRAALDVLGKMLMEARDSTIIQWDQILAVTRTYAPWERIVRKFPGLDEQSRKVVGEALPHIADTFLYCLLAELDASQTVGISVLSRNQMMTNIARLSWGLTTEPVGDDGWLARFSKQRFEQPI